MKKSSLWRLALPMTLGTAVLAVAVYFLLSYQPRREARRGFESKAEALTRVLAYSARAGVEFEDAAAVERDLQMARLERSITYVTVRDRAGALVAALHPDIAGSAPRLADGADLQMLEAGGQLHVGAPILVQDKEVGRMQVGFGMGELEASFASTRSASLAVALATALTGMGMAFFVSRRLLSARLAMLREIATTTGQLRAASAQILAACNEQAAGMVQHAGAVEETRRTMDALLEAARRIADASQQVFQNADRTARTTVSIAEAIKQLTGQAERIGDISEAIRSIADKSDLLALNASLEGSKAGEAGRGFALVAAEMRRLAESVMGAARQIKQLASDMRAASDSSVRAADEGRLLADRTSDSAREITLVTEQQRNATEQVSQSMSEVSRLLSRSSETTRQTERTAQALSTLADQLARLTASVTGDDTPEGTRSA